MSALPPIYLNSILIFIILAFFFFICIKYIYFYIRIFIYMYNVLGFKYRDINLCTDM